MDALSLSVACILCTAQSPAQPVSVARWQPLIAEASARFTIPQAWIARVIAAESGGRTTLDGKPITSSAGAMGLMQVVPWTFAEMQRQFGLGRDPYDPRTNILAGTAYLRTMYVRYGYPYLFAAYNAGPARFDAYLLHHRPLPSATIAYVDRVIPGSVMAFETTNGDQIRRQPMLAGAPKNVLFFAIGSGHGDASQASIEPKTRSSLFVRLSPPTP